MPFGVSNSFKRGTIKTYSRQRAREENSDDADRPRKRICMDKVGNVVAKDVNRDVLRPDEPADQSDLTTSPEETISSSISQPSSPALGKQSLLSSDVGQYEGSELSSPPSSPPEAFPSPAPTARKPTFSVLKRSMPVDSQVSLHRPLSEVTANARKGKPAPAGKKPLTQMQIDLGGEVRRTCRSCGMEYIPSVKEDSALHREFCGMHTAGIELGKRFWKDETLRRGISEYAVKEVIEEVVAVDRKCSLSVRNKVKRVLDFVNAELSAADIHAETLWEPRRTDASEKQVASKRKANLQHFENNEDRFKAFMYFIGDRCVGFCLAEKISNAQPVVGEILKQGEAAAAAVSSSISVSNTARIALLGISRIWTSKAFRNRGIAIRLLESARLNFFFGVQVPKRLVAFSQPTESGGRLAESWFGAKTGWCVYRGDW